MVRLVVWLAAITTIFFTWCNLGCSLVICNNFKKFISANCALKIIKSGLPIWRISKSSCPEVALFTSLTPKVVKAFLKLVCSVKFPISITAKAISLFPKYCPEKFARGRGNSCRISGAKVVLVCWVGADSSVLKGCSCKNCTTLRFNLGSWVIADPKFSNAFFFPPGACTFFLSHIGF